VVSQMKSPVGVAAKKDAGESKTLGIAERDSTKEILRISRREEEGAGQDGERDVVNSLVESHSAIPNISNSAEPGSPLPRDPNSLGSADSWPAAVWKILNAGMTKAACPRHYTPALQGKDNHRVGLLLRVDCWAFKCGVCGPRKRARWLNHLMCLFDG